MNPRFRPARRRGCGTSRNRARSSPAGSHPAVEDGGRLSLELDVALRSAGQKKSRTLSCHAIGPGAAFTPDHLRIPAAAIHDLHRRGPLGRVGERWRIGDVDTVVVELVVAGAVLIGLVITDLLGITDVFAVINPVR